jgi:hypothetical protein
MIKRLFILALILSPVAAQASPPYMNIPWTLTNSIGPAPFYTGPTGKVMLTSEVNNDNGAAWNPCTIDITQDFTFEFDMNFGNQTCGADGMTFTLQADSRGASTPPGVNAGAQGFAGINNSIAAVFDTFSNVPLGDPVYDSMDLYVGGNGTSIYPASCGGPGPDLTGSNCNRPQILAANTNAKDGLDHDVIVNWVASTATLTVTVDGSLRVTYIFPANYVSSLFGGNNNVYYGVTAHTGGFNNYQQFGQVSALSDGVPLNFSCKPTPTVIASLTPFVLPVNTCGAPTPIPTFTVTPPPTPYFSPTITLTPTDTLTPYPPGCGPPVFQEAKVLASGCLGGTGTVTTGTYTFATQPNQLLVLRVSTSSSSAVPSNVKFGAATMSTFASSIIAAGGAHLYTYYLADPPLTGTVNFTYANANCSWDVTTELYNNVDVSNPVSGSTAAITGVAGASSPFPYSLTYTTSGPASLISVFMNSDQAQCCPPTAAGSTLNMGLSTAGPASIDGGGAEGVSDFYQVVGGPGTYTLNFDGTQGGRWWGAQPMEIRGATCGTPSSTPTPSNTASDTPSRTPSPSPSATRSITPSATPSSTATDTNTVGPSPTFTSTSTQTSTSTGTPTATPSSTVSPQYTATDTPTATLSSTASPSATVTDSFSATPTLTSTPSVSQTPSATPSYSASPTFSSTPSLTDTPSVTPSYSPSPTFSATPSLSDTPTQTPSFSVTLTPSITDTQTVSATPTPSLTASLTFSASPSATPSWTVSATPQPMPNHVTLSVYNSAGELVKILFDGGAQYQLGELQFDQTLLLGGINTLHINFPGYLQGGSTSGVLWNATNASGQLIQSGVYTIKAQIVDNFGQVTTLQKSIEVVDATPQNSLDIYNSAGELVVSLPLPVASGTGHFESMRLSTAALGVKVDAATGVIQSAPLQIWVMDEHGTEYPVQWSGLNAQGAPVNSGSYIAELVYSPAGGGHQVVSTKSFVVLQAGNFASLDGAYAYPNPVMHGGDLFLHYNPSAGASISGRLFSLSGELVGQAADSGLSGILRFNGGDLAGGVYMVRLEKLSGSAVIASTMIKVAVVH